MSNSSGQLVGEVTRYTPYGAYRSGGPNAITDRGFTGQKENMELGLYYYNARYYVPYLNRFISADTIVPDPANPQSFNRYAYANNNPVRYTDPTGHYSCESANECQPRVGPANLAVRAQKFGIRFTSDEGESWTDTEKIVAVDAAYDVDKALRGLPRFQGYGLGRSFRSVYGVVTFNRSADTTWTDENGVAHEIDYGAYTRGRQIDFYDPAIGIDPLDPKFRYNVVHELGHAFNYVTVQASEADPYDDLGQALGNALPSRDKVRNGMGPYPLQQNTRGTKNTNYELFGDSFLNWTYGSFLRNSQGVKTSNWFGAQMSLWVSATGP